MWCDRAWGFVKRHSTVPGFVVVFAATYVLVLAMNAGETGAAWVQAIGSIAAIIAAWVIPYRHELAKETRQRHGVIESVGALGTRQAMLLQRLVLLMISPQVHANCDWEKEMTEWKVHHDVVEAIPPEVMIGFDISYLIYLREGAKFGLSAVEQASKWDLAYFDEPDMSLVNKAEAQKKHIANVARLALISTT